MSVSVCLLPLQVRGAFFRLICTYLQKQSSAIVLEKPLSQAVFSGLRETDPSVIVHAWETILVAVEKVEVTLCMLYEYSEVLI